jgi:endonuclease III
MNNEKINKILQRLSAKMKLAAPRNEVSLKQNSPKPETLLRETHPPGLSSPFIPTASHEGFRRKSIKNPHTELNYKNDFELLIAVMLSAHTTDKSVNNATEKLFAIAPTPKKMLALGANKLKKYIKGVGLYNAKTKYVLTTSKILIEKYKSHLPQTREELEALPGVGRKTANIILNVIFDQPTVAVDTHVFRVANRTKIAEGKTPIIVEEKLLKVVPKKYIKNLHYLLLLHGRYVCKAKTPECKTCVINNLCEYEKKLL